MSRMRPECSRWGTDPCLCPGAGTGWVSSGPRILRTAAPPGPSSAHLVSLWGSRDSQQGGQGQEHLPAPPLSQLSPVVLENLPTLRPSVSPCSPRTRRTATTATSVWCACQTCGTRSSCRAGTCACVTRALTRCVTRPATAPSAGCVSGAGGLSAACPGHSKLDAILGAGGGDPRRPCWHVCS